MRGTGDYQIRLLQVKGTFYNGVQVRADGQARLGQMAKAPQPGGGWRRYVDTASREGTPIPWVPAGWEQRVVRELSADW